MPIRKHEMLVRCFVLSQDNLIMSGLFWCLFCLCRKSRKNFVSCNP